ncbi:MAG TPA: HAMP domain-containing sensor histidine kinase, partial [Candidatus Nanoarchaeia archaeon]|nr:HAMP domain-containing sensor histidine kinase [Candidatus Nanoarchaeia archaeon]
MAQKRHFNLTTWLGISILTIAVVITAGVTWFLYGHTVNLLTENLRERLLSIVTTQVANIDVHDVEALQKEEDWKKPEWKRLVTRLKRSKDHNGDIVFMYVYRRNKDNPEQLEFVADAESINPYANADADSTNDVDANKDGVVEPDGPDYLQWPGQEYPEPPEDAFPAFNGPMTSRDLYEDAWGKVLTGYAPILNEKEDVVAVLAADIRANDFSTITTQTLIPFIAFILVLIGIILILAYSLIKIWNRQVELLRELDRQKDELMSIVRHQLAAPVTSLRWDTELLLGGDVGKLNAAQKEHVTSMYAIVTNLADLVEMVSEVSRVRLGLTKVDREKIDLAGLFKDIMAVIKPRIVERDIHFTESLPSSFPEAFLDRRLTRMPIENFLTNAVKYTPKKGKVTLTVTVCDGILCCEVTDTGCGIPKAEQKEIFGRLFR